MTPLDILNTNYNFAVIGFRAKPDTFAYKIYKKLEEKGKHVAGINPNISAFEDKTIYDSISDVPDKVDIAVMVVNPHIGITLLDDIKNKGINTIWLQPGTINNELLDKAALLNLNVVRACVLAVYGKD